MIFDHLKCIRLRITTIDFLSLLNPFNPNSKKIANFIQFRKNFIKYEEKTPFLPMNSVLGKAGGDFRIMR